jgi:hypothetical protein
MELKEILDRLTDGERAVVNAAFEAERAAVDREKQSGIRSYREAKQEAERLLVKFKPIEDALKQAGLDPAAAGFPSDLSAKLADAAEAGPARDRKTELERSVADMQRQMKALSDKYAAAEQAAAEATARARASTLSAALQSGLKDLIGPDFVIDGLIRSGAAKLDADERPMLVVNGREYDLDKGAAEFRRLRPDLFRNVQQPSSGSAPGGGGGPSNGRKTMTRAEFNALDPQAQTDKIVKEGFTITD